MSLFFCALEGRVQGSASTPVTASVVKKMEEKVATVMSKKNIPGLAVGIISGGNIVFSKGFGVRDLRTSQPVTPQTVFQLGSVSKTIAGTLTAILAEKKKLNLHQKVQDALPHHTFSDDSITLHHVVSHTTGISRAGFNPLIESEKKTQAEIHAQVAKTPLTCTPGTCYDYHNAAFSLIAPIVAKNTGESFEESLQTYLLTPLDMQHTSVTHDAILRAKNRAAPHVKTAKGHVASSTYRMGYYEVAPAGGVNSNLEDMLKFLQAQLGHAPNVLSKNILHTLHTPVTPAKDFFARSRVHKHHFKSSSYAIGWRVLDYRGHKIVFHGGWVKGFMNIIAFLPEKDVGIVVLQNGETSGHWILAMSLFDQVLGFPEQEWSQGGAYVIHTKKVKGGIKNVKNTLSSKKITPHKVIHKQKNIKTKRPPSQKISSQPKIVKFSKKLKRRLA